MEDATAPTYSPESWKNMIASHRAANVLATEEAVAAAAAAMAAEGPTEGNWSKDGIDSGGDSGAGPPPCNRDSGWFLFVLVTNH